MAYKTEELIKKALKVIKEENLYFIEDIAVFMGINKTTFYAHKLNENAEIKSAMDRENAKLKKRLRSNWENQTESTGLQIALYKLAGTEEDRRKLTSSYVQGSHEIKAAKLNLDNLTIEEIETLKKLQEKASPQNLLENGQDPGSPT